jgi:hypothetical protein
MAKGTDVAMEELIFAWEGFMSRRKSVQRGRRINPLSNGSMPGQRQYYGGYTCKGEIRSDTSSSATDADRISPSEFGQVTMNGVSFGRMPERTL